MRRRNRNGRTSYANGFVQLTWWLLDSPAFLRLTSNAGLAYVEFCRRYNGANNGHIAFSIRELAERRNVSNATAHKAIKELREKGFIKPREMGAFTRKDRHATEWILTAYEYANQPATKEFMRWKGDQRHPRASQERHPTPWYITKCVKY
jgi:hypothetical protein